MTRTTPSRPLDVTVAFPELASLARTAVRLHPLPGAPTVHDSSVGGPLLWPADEPWPEHEPTYRYSGRLTTLEDVRTLRAVLTRAWSRPRGPRQNLLNEREQELVDRIHAGHSAELLPPGPQPLIPLAQFYARDVPGLPFPEGTDLLQVLWVPSAEIEGCSPAVQLRWRLSSQVEQVLAAPPEPACVEDGDHVPEPCLLHPEPVREFPPSHLLDEEWAARLLKWSEEQSVDYGNDLSVAPGWKAGGWPAAFTFRDAADSDELHCGECGGPVEALLTIGSSEWDGATGSWRPVEEGQDSEDGEKPTGHPYRTTHEPTMVTIGRGYTLQVYYCVGTPSHLPRTIMQ
ncbi:hypothetical protein [Streptomyces chromofuscus]|uniref:LigA protein n=1 Tax=Streptomyces chromofuscus TaxID=42881 RepID=A0A7M2T9E4_STRCW|nr:hypothetical protein [Streptomyces chromofuscus]QOV44874.1 hypothetical protein IPT68_02365 [Streptomyces chromofuscus]GGT33855.1 hypothetical protein GCM10010254_62980 [Streptomyces chromofuscus]